MVDTDDLNIGDKVIYQAQDAIVVDHYGKGVYAIAINGQWLSVHRRELELCS
jgi:hypothetical protein